VAFALKDGLEAAGVNVSVIKTTETEDIDYFDYDLYSVASTQAGYRVFAQKI
jgi:hypothetical protein